MESVENQELEYESDPEESKLSLTMMRRREASDDEDEGKDIVGTSGMPVRRFDFQVSDCESEDEGAPNEYNDEEFEGECGELDGEIEGENEYVERVGVSDVEVVALELDKVVGINRVEEGEKENDGGVYLEGYDQFGDNVVDEKVEEGVEGENKESEPFAVPTAGAFYMHDDRFRESRAGGRHRRTFGGRRIWESKDDRRWGHDKFEEVTMRERNYDEGRRGSRGHNRGSGKGRGEERSYPRSGNKALNNKNQNNAPNNNDNTNNQNNALDKQSNAVNYQKKMPKGERGRDPRRYQPTWKKHESPAEYKQREKSSERTSYVNSGRTSGHTSSADNDSVPAMKHMFSGLNSASPPFYPSASSNLEISFGQKIDKPFARTRLNQQSSVGDGSFSMSQSNTMQGKNVADFAGINKLYIDDSPFYSKKSPGNLQLQDSEFSSINLSQSLQFRVQRGDLGQMERMSYLSNATHNQVKRASTSFKNINAQRIPVQTRDQISLQAPSQQFDPRPHCGNPTSYSNEPEEIDSLLESSTSGTSFVGKGKGSIKGHGGGSFPYGGIQVIGASGNIGSAIGDQNFSANPTFLPVMQFGDQHPGGMGVPAVGMAFPGYVDNPESGKSEMTWLPVLAGAAGAMGASYCNPYLSVDSAYHARPSGQTPPTAAALRENNMLKPGNELKPSQRPDLANDKFRQRQNKSRRYTEMKFDQ